MGSFHAFFVSRENSALPKEAIAKQEEGAVQARQQEPARGAGESLDGLGPAHDGALNLQAHQPT